MGIMKIVFLILLGVLFFSNLSVADNRVCAKNKEVVAPCYSVQGTLMYHANMRPYLHISNSNRILGIKEQDGLPIWPNEVSENLSYDKDLIGDFTVCPFTKAEKNKMQLVCIEDVDDFKSKPNFLATKP